MTAANGNSKTLTVFILCRPAKVYEFASKPENLPRWATTFAKSIAKEGNGWVLQTGQGPCGLRIEEPNPYGILDHYVSPLPGVELYVPMRVVAHGGGAEVIFTLFQMEGMTAERFAADLELVRRDLQTLKRLMEQEPAESAPAR